MLASVSWSFSDRASGFLSSAFVWSYSGFFHGLVCRSVSKVKWLSSIWVQEKADVCWRHVRNVMCLKSNLWGQYLGQQVFSAPLSSSGCELDSAPAAAADTGPALLFDPLWLVQILTFINLLFQVLLRLLCVCLCGLSNKLSVTHYFLTGECAAVCVEDLCSFSGYHVIFCCCCFALFSDADI